jgi:hypothetical protein
VSLMLVLVPRASPSHGDLGLTTMIAG